ncbi:hypothetical protein [Tumebacillus flagellatus]|uniref:Uncharacterized protein n=1 Tax=Tumebacillus flagellatus TaxID=1157490 RepID=A0A074LNC3_9BACL|nr:hypothetical protein [Tumebacillus flagellatus]KEO81353.1 hypothetical protein EL26_21180 [Tumebacillus flagellatus]
MPNGTGNGQNSPEQSRMIERKLRRLEKLVEAEIGPMRRIREFEDDEKERDIKFWEKFVQANSGSFRDQMIRQYVVYRMGFMYEFGDGNTKALP